MSPFRRSASMFGPGVVTGASDDDPSGIATYTQAGALFGLGALWTILFTIPLMAAVQESCARISLVTRRGLFANLSRRLPAPVMWTLVALLVLVNAFNLGADLQIMAASIGLLSPGPGWAWLVGFLLFTLALQIFVSYRQYERFLKWLVFSLLAYVAVAFTIHIDWFSAALATFVPVIRFRADYAMMIVALFGTTLSPYLYVWQSAQEVEELPMERGPVAENLFCRRIDVNLGMILSNAIAWFILVTAASVLYSRGLFDIQTPAEAAAVLAPIAGPYASWLFAAGVIGTGLLAIPILSSSAAYAVAETAGWKKAGLSQTWKTGRKFYSTVIAVTLLGSLVPLLGLNPIRVLIYAAIGNALLAPFLLFGIILLTEDRTLLGKQVNGPFVRVLLWITFLVMIGSLVMWGVLR